MCLCVCVGGGVYRESPRMVLARIGDINPGEAQRGEVWKREVEEQIQAHLGVCVRERESVCECV